MKTMIVAVVWSATTLAAATAGGGYLLGAVTRRTALLPAMAAAVASAGAAATAIYKEQPAIAVVASMCAVAFTAFGWWEHMSSKELTRVNTSSKVVGDSEGKPLLIP